MIHLPTGPALLALIDSRLLYRRETYAATGVCFVSNSTLKATAACSTQDVLSSLGYGPLDGESVPQRAGVACHEALAVWFRGGTTQVALAAFETSYAAFAAERGLTDDDRLSYANVYDVLRAWLEWADHNFPYRRLDAAFSEVPFLVPLLDDGSIVLGGRIDTFVADDSGALLLTDHKAQPLDARILTPLGWRRMGDIAVGDLVIGADGRSTRVLGVYPQGVQPSFRVSFRDGGETHCSADHLWTTQRYSGWKREPWSTRPLAALIEDTVSHRIPIASPVHFAPQTAPFQLNPYVLGVLLGDGYLAGNSVELSATEPEIVSAVAARLPSDVRIRKSSGANHTWTIARAGSHGGQKNSVQRALETLGLRGCLSSTKFVPECYLRASIEDRTALLAGLMDTDGGSYKGTPYFSTVSTRLRDAVVELVRSLGGLARWRLARGTKQQAYRVSLRLPNGQTPFWLTRKARLPVSTGRFKGRYVAAIVSADPSPMQCIRVEREDGLYITDDYLVTHNTTGKLDGRFIRSFEMDSQFSTYLWGARADAARAGLPAEHIIGGLVNAIQLIPLPASDRKCAKHGVAYAECRDLHLVAERIGIIERTHAFLDESWLPTARALAAHHRALLDSFADVSQIAAVPMEGQFNGACATCDFAAFCKANRPVELVDSMLRREPYTDPLTHEAETR